MIIAKLFVKIRKIFAFERNSNNFTKVNPCTICHIQMRLVLNSNEVLCTYSMRIIIFDRDEHLLKSFKTFFELCRCDVITTTEHLNAISLVHTFEADVLISEYVPNDPEFLKRIGMLRKNKPQTEVVILACFENEIDLQPLLNVGIVSIFTKPIDPTLLYNMIKKDESKSEMLNILR